MPSYLNPGSRRQQGRVPRELPDEPSFEVPKLPAKCGWPKRQRDWWRGVWSSPLASEWDPALDFETVFRLGGLYVAVNAPGADPTAAMLAQIAKLESELGLTPAARRRQYVRLPSPSSAPSPQEQERHDEMSRRRAERAQRLGVDAGTGVRAIDPKELEHG